MYYHKIDTERVVTIAKIFILGSGSFGTAMAVLFGKAGHEVYLWGRNTELQRTLATERENKRYLKGVPFPDSVNVVEGTEKLGECDRVFILVPTVGVRETAKLCAGKLKDGAVLVCGAKGLEQSSLLRMSEVVAEENPNVPIVAISGPSHAEEIALGVPTAVVAASADIEAAQQIQALSEGSTLRIYTSKDIVGVELGGALKNIIAFAAGVIDGMKAGDNAKAGLMTRGLTEIIRLGVAMGASPLTFSGLSGVGDLIVTCTSVHSRNRKAGLLMGQGKSVDEAVAEVGMVVEGINATMCAYDLAQKYSVDMPITTAIHSFLTGKNTLRGAINSLLVRPQKFETEESWLFQG